MPWRAQNCARVGYGPSARSLLLVREFFSAGGAPTPLGLSDPELCAPSTAVGAQATGRDIPLFADPAAGRVFRVAAAEAAHALRWGRWGREVAFSPLGCVSL